MSWPTLLESVRTIDMSRYQNLKDEDADRELGRVNFSELATQHPEIRVVVSRFAGSSSGIDPDGGYNYDEALLAGFDVGAYVNINPTKKVSDLLNGWWAPAIGTRKVPHIWLDCETTLGQTPATVTAHVRACWDALRSTWPEAQVIIYTGAWWWDPNIIHGWEDDHNFALASYPPLVPESDETARAAENFEESDPLLPIGNNFTPRIPKGVNPARVVDWQFSNKGIIEPITKQPKALPRVDLNYMLKAYADFVWPGEPVPPPIPTGLDKFMRDEAKKLDAVSAELKAKADSF